MNGQEIRERAPWNTTVTADSIRHFALGISDDNPLWLDREYASRSRYGRLTAPPAFLASVLYPLLHGAPESALDNLIARLEFRWFAPLVEGDRLRGTAQQTGAEDRRKQTEPAQPDV